MDNLKVLLDRESTEVESNLIAALLADITLITDLKINESYFTNSACKEIFKAIHDLDKNNKDINIISLKDILKNKVSVSELSNLYSNGELVKNLFSTLQNKIISNNNKRKCYSLSKEINQKLVNGDDPQQIFNHISNRIEQTDTEDNAINSISDLLMNTLDKIEDKYKNGGTISGMATGYKQLDSILNGIEKKKYIIIGARPSIGKTAFSLELTRRLAVKNNVLYFSLEMSKEELGERLISSHNAIKNYKIKTGKLNEDDFSRIMNGMGKLNQLKLSVNDTGNLTVEELSRQALRYKLKNGLDVVIVDYLTLLSTEEKFMGTREKVNYISTKLRILAKKLDVAVICLAQLNRNVEGRSNKIPTIADIRETGNIEQDANIILLLHTEEKKESEENTGPEELNVIIGKNRAGISNKTIVFNYYKQTQIIDEKYI